MHYGPDALPGTQHIKALKKSLHKSTTATTTTTIEPYRSTGISQHIQLRTGGFCWSKVSLLRALADNWQLAHSN